MPIYAVFAGTGSYIPTVVVPNEDFLRSEFYDAEGKRIETPNEQTIAKFREITGIERRRYVTDDLNASDIGYFAAKDALESSGIDPETLDYIIFAHNFGDVRQDRKYSDFVPNLAARVKHRLQIKNPKTICHDTPFGCPGWTQGLIQANYYIKSGDAKKVMVIGAETLFRISDPHDRDSMIYADGGALGILVARLSEKPVGILSHSSRSDTFEHAYLLRMGPSYNPHYQGEGIFLHMNGHKLYEYALKTVPLVVKESIDKAGLHLKDVSKVLIHQANQKMDEAILTRLFRLYGLKEEDIPSDIMPMTLSWLGNSSVATVPTLLDLIQKGKLDGQKLEPGQNIVIASVGAGMNITSLVVKMPED